LSSVDFPEPDGPMIETSSPFGIVNVISSSAVTCRFPANCLVTRSRSITSDYVNAFTKPVKWRGFGRSSSRLASAGHSRAPAALAGSGTIRAPMTLPPRDSFTPDEQRALAPYFTNTDRPVFALTNLPETVKGALFARYSRSAKSLRRLFLDEFRGEMTAAPATPNAAGTGRADRLYARVLNEYGD